MALISLSDFQKLSGLSDRALINLLKKNKLVCKLDDQSGLLIDSSSIENSALIKSMSEAQRAELDDRQKLVEERAGRIVTEMLDSIVDEAIALYLSRAGSAPNTRK